MSHSVASRFAARSNGLTAAFLAALALAVPAAAQLGSPTKEPTGPFVVQDPGTGDYMVPAGEVIIWEITIPAPPIADLSGTLIDEPQNAECEAGGMNEFGVGGAAEENAPQDALFYEDLDSDGDCDEAVLEAPAGSVVDCDPARQRLEISGFVIPAGTSGTFRIRTPVSADLEPGLEVCNWAHFVDSTGVYRGSTGPPGSPVASCTCARITAPTGIDFESEKTVTLDNPPPLIPGDPTSTVVYTVTLRNTSDDDLSGLQYIDDLSAAPNEGLVWTEIVDCPMPLVCTLDSPEVLRVTGWDLPGGMDPPAEQTIQARAEVTCDAATDDDTGRICNRGEFILMGVRFPTDDPTVGGTEDPTCTPVIFSNLTESTKQMNGFDDTNGNSQLDPGERVNFRITARNTGRLTAEDVIVTDDVGAPGCFDVATLDAPGAVDTTGGVITWEAGSIVGGGSVDLDFSVVVNDASCCNQAFLQSLEREDCELAPIPTDDPSTGMTSGDPTCIATGPQPDIQAEKTVELIDDPGGDGEIHIGDVVRWTVVITNEGAGPATEAQFNDELPFCNRDFDAMPNVMTSAADGDWGDNASTPFAPPVSAGEVIIERLGGDDGIQPGETITIQFDVEVSVTVEGCCNQGFVSFAEAAEPVPTDDPASMGSVGDATCLTPPSPEPEGELEKSVVTIDENADGFLCTGESVRYTLTMRSVGNAPLTDIVIDDLSTECVELDPSTLVITGPGTDTSTGMDVQVSIASLAPTEETELVFEGTILQEGECCNDDAQWTSTEVPGPTLADGNTSAPGRQRVCHTATCPPTPDVQLVVEKTVDPAGCVEPGASVTFTLSVDNTGADPVAAFSLEDVLPPELVNVMATAPLTYDATGHRVFVDDGGALGPDDPPIEFRYTAEIDCTPSGRVQNMVMITYDDGAGGTRMHSDTATIEWGSPDLSVTKTFVITEDPSTTNGWVDPGESVTFTLEVCNDAAGPCGTALAVQLVDTLDTRFDEATFADPDDGGTLVGQDVTWMVGDLAPGGTCVTVDFDIVFDDTDMSLREGQRVPNTFEATATGNDFGACAGDPGLPPLAVESGPATGPGGTAGVPYGDPSLDPNTVDLLRNDETAGRETALLLLATQVFENETANTGTCGETSLNVDTDVVMPDVGMTIGDGVEIGWGDGPVVYFELSELCTPAEGGADELLCIRKAATAGSVLVATAPDPSTCP